MRFPGEHGCLEAFTRLIPFVSGREIVRQQISDLTLVRMMLDLFL